MEGPVGREPLDGRSDGERKVAAAFLRIGELMLAEWQKTAGADGEALIKAYRGR